MRKIFAGIILVMALCGMSWADIVYTTDEGNLGLIQADGIYDIKAPEIQYSGLGNNAFVTAYWDGKKSNIIAINRNTDNPESEDTAVIFSAQNLDSPVGYERTLSGVHNTHSAPGSYNGRSIFVASRENASIVEFGTENFKPVHSYKYKASSEDYAPHMQNIIMNYGNVYGLVDDGEKGVLLKFDGQLRDNIKGFTRIDILGYKVNLMSWLTHSRIAVAADSGVGLVNKDGLSLVFSTDIPVTALCPDNGDGFYFATQMQSGDEYINTLYHYTDGEAFVIKDNETGANCSMILSHNKNIMAAITSEKIQLYSASSGEFLREYDSDALGGVPVSFTERYAGGMDDDNSHGSCGISAGGLALLLLCASAVYCKGTFGRR